MTWLERKTNEGRNRMDLLSRHYQDVTIGNKFMFKEKNIRSHILGYRKLKFLMVLSLLYPLLTGKTQLHPTAIFFQSMEQFLCNLNDFWRWYRKVFISKPGNSIKKRILLLVGRAIYCPTCWKIIKVKYFYAPSLIKYYFTNLTFK